MNNVLKAIKLKEDLDVLRPLSSEDESRIMQKFRLDWNYHSNNLEGNTLTYGETKALIMFGLTAQGKPLKDHFEVTGHDEAIKWILEIIHQNRPLNENFIRELHKLILKESYEVDAITEDGKPTKKRIQVGVYKSLPNHVKTKTGEIFRFATPEETPALMNDLINWYREKISNENYNPILAAAEFHYKFISIHPFDDGNGRTARILMNFILLQSNYPPVVIKTEDKENYFAALRQADSGNIEPFIDYIAINLIQSLEIMIKGAKGEKIEEPDDIEKEIALLEQRLKAMGKSIETTKTTKSLRDLYDHTIAKIVKLFFEKGKLFDKFYVNSSFTVYFSGLGSQYNKPTIEDFIKSIRSSFKQNTQQVRLLYSYQAFNQIGFNEFSTESSINITFEITRYTIQNKNAKVSYQKLYGEHLTDEEISNLVNTEVRLHKETIEKRISDQNNKK